LTAKLVKIFLVTNILLKKFLAKDGFVFLTLLIRCLTSKTHNRRERYFRNLRKEKKEKKVGSIHKIEYLCTDYEKSRNEKSRNMENPFKFGTIVEAEYFTEKNFMCL